MVRNRPIVLSDGEYLLPAYHETGHDPESVGADSTSLFFRFDPRRPGLGWERAGEIKSPKGNIQPAPVELAPGRLVAYCRRGGDYLPATKGFLVRSKSTDDGLTWSPGVDSAFPNPNAAVDFLRLKSGRLLLAFNDCFHGRTPLTVALSDDGDGTYPVRRNLAEGPGDFGYPQVLQDAEGVIHAVYTSERRTVVNHAVFDESWVRGR
jgi:predicted neuraminidase